MKSKKQKKNRNNKKQEQHQANSNELTINRREMIEAIVSAHHIIEEQKLQREVESERIAKQEWQEIMGQKEYPENEKWLWKHIHVLRNDCVAMWKLFSFNAKNARDLRATFALMTFTLNIIFRLCKWCLYILAIVFAVSVLLNGVDSLPYLAIAFLILGLARLCRVASFEVEEIKDGNILIALFSSGVSFVALVIAIITIFIK